MALNVLWRSRITNAAVGLFSHAPDPLASTFDHPGDPGLLGPDSVTWQAYYGRCQDVRPRARSGFDVPLWGAYHQTEKPHVTVPAKEPPTQGHADPPHRRGWHRLTYLQGPQPIPLRGEW